LTYELPTPVVGSKVGPARGAVSQVSLEQGDAVLVERRLEVIEEQPDEIATRQM
jgi:hypothetical protein